MKKALLLLASAALLFAGCAKEQIAGQQDGELTNVTLTANLDNGTTKADADGDGAAASVNRCIMEIYYGDALYARQYAPVDAQKKATFTAQVVSNRQYTVAFWADNVDELATDKYYTTTSLKEIAINGSYIGNDDARDAFYVCEPFTVQQAGGSFTATLKRPFAQMNVITTDWDKAASVAGLAPETVKVTLKNVMTGFNAVTGEISAAQDIVYEVAVYTPALNGAEKTLSMDYLFASAEKAVIDIDWKAKKTGDADVKHAFAAVPYQRNYRTNIKGALLTTQGQWTVTVDSDWTGNGSTVEGGTDPYLVNYFEAGSIAAANEALKTNNAVSIENPSDLGTAIVIPAEQDDKNVLIKVTGASAGDIKVKKATDNGPASLAIESDSKTLDIDLPNSHVDVNNGVNYTAITAKTGDNTLVIGKDVIAAALNVQKGSVEIHGKVANLERASGVKAAMYASDRATLINYINWAKPNETVYLECDINLAGENWTPIMAGTIEATATIDGCNHAIKNMIVKGGDAGAGFLYCNSGIVKNLTIDNATVEGATEDKGNMYGIVAGYAYGNATFENITVKNSKIHAFGKVSAILGMAADGNGTTVVKNCKVENTEIIGCYNVANYVGLLQNAIVLEGCTSTNVTKSIGGRYGEEAYVTFDNVKVINNSDPANPKYVLSSGKYWKYVSGSNIYYYSAFADCYNDIHYDGWKALDGTVDGLVFNTPETPQPIDLEPVATIGTTKYYDLPSALTALQQGETLEIVQAGEYTVQTLSAPSNSVIEAKVDGVVFNRTAGGSVTSYGTTSPVTVKNITWNIGSNNYQYFNCKVENCTINGRPSIHTFASFKGCTLINTYASDYCITTYGSPCTFENCTFSSQGKFVNVYGESQSSSKEVTATNCKFVNLKSSVYKAAFNIKGNADGQIQHTHVVIENCTTEGLFPDHTTTDGNAIFFDGGLIMFDDPAWEADVYAVVDGITYYPYFTMDADGNYSVKNANGLKMAIKHWNALKAAGEKSITLADGTYNASDMAIFQNYANKSLLIKAENEKQAVITPTAGSKQLIFVVAGMSKTYAGHITIDGIKFDFSNASNKDIESDVIRSSDANGTYLPSDEKALYTGTYHYCHDITVKNCEIIGLGLVTEEDGSTNANEHCSVVRADGGNQNAYNVKVQNCVIDKVGYVLTSAITTYAEVSGCTVTDSKCVINNTKDQTEYKIINNTISTYHDYCIRVDYGPLTVSNNEFDCKYSGTDSKAGVVVLRTSTGNKATITGNTFTKASAAMNDVYCKSSWKIDNGDVTKTIPANTGIKDISKLSEPEL